MSEIKKVENEVQETEKKGFGTKVKDFFAKHGKKIVAVAGVGLAGVAGYLLGKNAGGEVSADDVDDLVEFYGDDSDDEE